MPFPLVKLLYVLFQQSPFRQAAIGWFIALAGTIAFLPAKAQKIIFQTADDSLFNAYCRPHPVTGGAASFYIVRFRTADMTAVQGMTIRRRISSRLAIVQPDTGIDLHTLPGIDTLAPAGHQWKEAASLRRQPAGWRAATAQQVQFSITAHPLDSLLSSLRRRKIDFELIATFREAEAALIRCTPATLLQQVLPEPALRFASPDVRPRPDLMVSGYDRGISQLNLADALYPEANGKGITIGIKEKKMDEADIDLQKRVLPSSLAAPDRETHASIVATLAGGAGNSFYTGKGPASQCLLFPSSFQVLFPDSSPILVQNKVTVQNHSYGTQIQPFYGAEAMSYDVQTRHNPVLLHVFSSGNQGTGSAVTGPYAHLNGFSNLTGNFKAAKNVITVAAVDTATRLAPFSSSGPLYDGRLAPQLTALGANGTSEAAALVSGAAAVLQQVFKDLHAQVMPPASLVKALLFTTCDDIGRKGIDYASGFGLLNLPRAIACLRQQYYDSGTLQPAQTWTRNLVVPAGAANLKITLTWTDTAGGVNDYRALVNDLDLELVQAGTGMVYQPWVLRTAPHADSLVKEPERKRDSLNTAEQVSIDRPAPGTYQVRVTTRRVQTTRQDFHLAYTWDTLNTVRFTNPVQASDINRRENPLLHIRWQAAVTDTNSTASLWITYNNGQSWQTVGTGVRLSHQAFRWPVPDTTAVAQLRMDCSFGRFYSARFVIAPLSTLRVDFRCNDSMRLSWPKQQLATGYQLYKLGDTAFLKPFSVVTDTFTVLNRLIHPEDTYAVQPLLPDGVVAARSVAVNISTQGVRCFYNTLFAEATGDSATITLVLGFHSGIDSLVFEKVTASGSFVRLLQTTVPNPNNLLYQAADHAPTAGTNDYRVGIWIKGRVVYTEIVSVVHQGRLVLLLYPNPVRRGQPIRLLTRETAGLHTFYLVDATGRKAGEYTVHSSGTIPTGPLPSGLYFYRLTDGAGSTVATGKMLVQ